MTCIREVLLALAAVVVVPQAALAQQWAREMFDEEQHDFGTVARGAEAEHRFTLTNLYRDDVHIAGIRTSCGCTTAWATRDTLESGQQGEIVARYHTDRFTGRRGATLTVMIDRPAFAEVQLRVDGYIRSDVVLHPGTVDFGTIDQGTPGETVIAVSYAGRNDWKIVEVKTPGPYIEADLAETARAAGRVDYELVVRLKPDAPAGYIQDQLLLVTNDRRLRQVPVNVTGRVMTALTVSPASLSLGTLEAGEQTIKRLIVQGRRPLRIVEVRSDDERFTFVAPQGSQAVQVITVRYDAPDEPGRIAGTITIETDDPAHGTIEVPAWVTVTEAQPAAGSRGARQR